MSTLSGRRAAGSGQDSHELRVEGAEDSERKPPAPVAAMDFATTVRSLESVLRSGLADPGHLGALAWESTRWGPTIATPVDAAGRRFPNRLALIDDFGSLNYADLKRRSDRLAGGMAQAGFTRFDRIAVVCSNHRGFVEALVASAKLGCRTVLVNPTLGAPQLAQIVESEGVSVVIHDAQISDVVAEAVPGALAVPAEPEADSAWTFPTITPAPLKRRSGQVRNASLPVLMTSGTTGVPKGAERESPPPDLAAATGLLQMIPYRAGDTAVIAAPLFHAWGLANLTMTATLAGTMVLQRRFVATDVLDAIDEHRPRLLVVVPVMLSRLIEARADIEGAKHTTAAHTLSTVEVVATSGSAIGPGLVERWISECGANLYNLYGSTEVGQATIAGPDDLTHSPATAGRVVPGSRVAVLDADGEVCPAMETGAIFVGSSFGFTRYTDGADKPRIDGLTATGDTGYFDADGRLFVLGREDDMIVSGGENVFPGEVEDLLAGHPDIIDVGVVAVPDDEFGQRLAAHIVKRTGAKLSKAKVRAHVRAELAPFKVPRDVVWAKALPRTTTGKLQRRKLS